MVSELRSVGVMPQNFSGGVHLIISVNCTCFLIISFSAGNRPVMVPYLYPGTVATLSKHNWTKQTYGWHHFFIIFRIQQLLNSITKINPTDRYKILLDKQIK